MAEKILIISPIPVFPEHAGNRKRIQTICSELMARGYVLDFFYTGFKDEISQNHQTFFNGDVFEHLISSDRVRWTEKPLIRFHEIVQGVQVIIEKWVRFFKEGRHSSEFNRSLNEYRNFGKKILLENQISANQYRAVIVNYAPYSFYFDYFDHQTIKIIDTHDKLTDRYRLFTENNEAPVKWHSLRKIDEKRALKKADVVWSIAENEKSYFDQLLTEYSVHVYTLSHLIPFRRIENQNSENSVVMIGSSNRLNIDGLTWFLEQVWKKIKHYDFQLKFIIAGSICETVDESLFGENAILFGKFDLPEEIYSKGDLFINPMQEGTGLKIKTYEALAHGKFILSTKEGASGLSEFEGNGLFSSNDPAKWIKQIKEFFEERNKENKHLSNAAKMVNRIYKENLDVITKSLK